MMSRALWSAGVALALVSGCTQIGDRIPDPNEPPFSLANVPFTDVDPLIDGRATDHAEWRNAERLPDIFFAGPASRAGFYYFQSRLGWRATSLRSNAEATYPGHTLFVAHDIVGSSDPANMLNQFQIDHDRDWNSFEFLVPGGRATIWVFDDEDDPDDGDWLPFAEGLDRSALIPEGSAPNLIDDRGFVARLNDDPRTDVHWFEGMPEPGDAAWDWRDWHYVFGRHHFGTSFQDVGLDRDPENAVPHEVYEFIAYTTPWPDGDVGGSGGGGGPAEPPKWCIWWDWVTVTEKRARDVIVIKDGTPRRAELIQTVDRRVPILRGQFWLHFPFPRLLGDPGGLGLGELALNQLDLAMETMELSQNARLELGEARAAFASAFDDGLAARDNAALFEQLDAGYAHLDRAKAAGADVVPLANFEIQALSAVATFAAERAMALDEAGRPIDDPVLRDAYVGLYEFGRSVNAMADGADVPAPRDAARKLKRVFNALAGAGE